MKHTRFHHLVGRRCFDFASRCATAKAVLDYDFFTILPIDIPEAKDIVQRFKVSVLIDQDFIEEDISEPRSFYRTVYSGENISLLIEYSDYSVARTLQTTVQSWVAGLKASEPSKFANWMSRNLETVEVIVPRLMGVVSIVGAYIALKPAMLATLIAIAQLVLASFALYVGFTTLGIILTLNFYRLLHLTKPLTFIRISQGDEDRIRIYEAKKSKRQKTIGLILVTVVLSLCINLLSSYIFEAIR